MALCHYCGEEIEFRYLEGRSTPIHINGGRCYGYVGSAPSASAKPFSTVKSYVNPNARCPVCRKSVFFYQSPYGGRVFFDNLGWPWPKHGCTDQTLAQTGRVETVKVGDQSIFRTAQGKSLEIYELGDLQEGESDIVLKFRKVGQTIAFTSSISKSELDAGRIGIEDITQAPSFAVATYSDHRTIEFISVRQRRIMSLKLRRVRT